MKTTIEAIFTCFVHLFVYVIIDSTINYQDKPDIAELNKTMLHFYYDSPAEKVNACMPLVINMVFFQVYITN